MTLDISWLVILSHESPKMNQTSSKRNVAVAARLPLPGQKFKTGGGTEGEGREAKHQHRAAWFLKLASSITFMDEMDGLTPLVN